MLKEKVKHYNITILLLFFIFSLFSCVNNKQKNEDVNNQQKEADTVFTIPEGAVRISLDEKKIKIPVIFNDSISSSLIFDSGLHENIIVDSVFASKNGLFENVSLKKRIAIQQMLKHYPFPAYFSFGKKILKIKIGNDSVIVHNFYILDLKRTFNCPADMLVGSSFFDKRIFTINYQKLYFKFFDNLNQETLSAYDSANLIKLNRNCYGIEAELKFNDSCKVKQNFMFDTGFSKYLWITNMEEKDILKISKSIPEKETFFVLDLSKRIRNLYKSEFIINDKYVFPFIFEKPVATLSPRSDYNGILGNDFLYSFDPIFDFKNDKFYFKKNVSEKILQKTKLGIQLGFYTFVFKTKKAIITGVKLNSQAEKLGIKPKDSLISINDKPINTIDVKNYLFNVPFDKFIQLKLKRKDSIYQVSIKKITF